MSVEEITIGDPFFSVKLIKSNKNIFVNGKAIVLNLSKTNEPHESQRGD